MNIKFLSNVLHDNQEFNAGDVANGMTDQYALALIDAGVAEEVKEGKEPRNPKTVDLSSSDGDGEESFTVGEDTYTTKKDKNGKTIYQKNGKNTSKAKYESEKAKLESVDEESDDSSDGDGEEE